MLHTSIGEAIIADVQLQENGNHGTSDKHVSQHELKKKQSDFICRFIAQMVSVAFKLETKDLYSPNRGVARISRARQISMYLIHTSASLSFVEIATFFARDRTTVSHACNVIEELRDIPRFDFHLSGMEKIIQMVMKIQSESLVEADDGI